MREEKQVKAARKQQSEQNSDSDSPGPPKLFRSSSEEPSKNEVPANSSGDSSIKESEDERYLKRLQEIREMVAQRREELRLGNAGANSTSEGSAGSAGAKAIAKPNLPEKRGEP